MKTVTQHLSALAANIERDIVVLAGKSRLEFEDRSNWPLIVIGRGEYLWVALDTTGKRLQAKIVEAHAHYAALMRYLLSGHADAEKFAELDEEVMVPVLQAEPAYQDNLAGLTVSSVAALRAQVALLEGLYAASEEEVVLVPDTNALLYFPKLELWQFPGISRFRLLLTPVVLAELDAHKMNHKNERLRTKATALVNLVKEFMRRGDIHEGVPVVRGRIAIQAVPLEPKASAILPWLDLERADDRFLASTMEAMRQHSRSAVALVTRDINLQNRCAHAAIPFLEPPEPPVPAAAPKGKARAANTPRRKSP